MAYRKFIARNGHIEFWRQSKDHTNVPDHYLKWMLEKINAGEGNFHIVDRGRKLSPAEVKAILTQELQKRQGGGNVTQPQSPQQPQPQNSPKSQPKWTWAKSIAVKPEYGLPAIGLDLAVKQYDENNWIFVILDKEEGRIVSRGQIPFAEIKNFVKSEKNEHGQLVQGQKPSEILKAITPEKSSGGGNGQIPERYITDEQREIDAKFERMLASSTQDHMVINALAGSGKTTMLKHLAHKYGKGKKWLYLVFNSKNREEATEEFPSTVQVETTNSFAGKEVLAKNNLKPTDRIADYSTQEKASMVADLPAFVELMKSLNIPDYKEKYGDNPKQLGGTQKSLWYLLRAIVAEFKREAVKLLGLAKSFGIDPRNKNTLDEEIQKIIDNYDINTKLENVKEKILKTSPWAAEYIADIMGQDFINRDFTKELKEATKWLMHQVLPHATQEEFTFDADPRKRGHIGQTRSLGTVRDFDDDLWFAAIHANELTWPKYQVVLADEVQDFNMAQKIMLQKLAEAGAKIVAVGDPNQAIYRFRGADGDAFKGISDMLKEKSTNKDDVEKGLTANFRSRQAIIDFANQEGESAGHVSNLVKGRPFKEEPGRIGKGVATHGEVTYDDAFDTLAKEMKDMGEIKQTAFLARTNEPLVHASLKLMAQGTPFIILGKDIAADLNKHINKITDLFYLSNTSEVEELQEKITSYNAEQQDAHFGSAAKAANLKELQEITKAMEASIEQYISENPRGGSIIEFRRWLNKKFGGLDLDAGGLAGKKAREEYKKELEERNPVILSTVHKSKGLQFQRVYILRDDQWPHPRSKREADLKQELNNKYIGRTRAEDELHVLKVKGQPGVPEK